MLFLSPLIFSGILGALFVRVMTKSASIRFYPLFILSLAFPTGLSICSLLIFGSYLLNSSQGPFISIMLSLGLATFFGVHLLLQKTAPRIKPLPALLPSAQDKWSQFSRIQKILILFSVLVWIFSFFKLWTLFQAVSLSNISGGWDARFFWNVKASFFFRNPEEWKNMFSSTLSWTHPDYPLLVPGAVAWGWNWTGKELQVWPAVISAIFLFSFALLIAWHIISYVSIFSGLIASAFFMTLGAFSFWGVSQYADVPISYFMTASGVILLTAFRLKNKLLFFLAGWLAACSAWTKNEGLFFLGWFGLVAFFIFIKNRKTILNWKSLLILLSLGMAIPFLAVFVLKTSLAESGDYLGSGRGLAHYAQSIFMDWPKTKIILQAFPLYMLDRTSWNGLWILFFTACIFQLVIKRLRTSDVGVTGSLAMFILLGYFIVLHTSPHQVVWQIQTALQRLLLHSAGLALIFTFEVYGQMLGSTKSIKRS